MGTDANGWGCCSSHQGLAKCPRNKPVMCGVSLCLGDAENCCDFIGGGSCNILGGRRLCKKSEAAKNQGTKNTGLVIIKEH